MLLKTGAKAELHVFGKGSHGFGLGAEAGRAGALWPESFAAWLSDCGMTQNPTHKRRIEGER